MDGLVTVEVETIGMTNLIYLSFIIPLNSSIYGSIKTEKFKILCIIIAVPHSNEICNKQSTEIN